MFGIFKERQRRRLRAQPVPPAWREIISRQLPFFDRLSPNDQKELLGHVQVFLAEKRFEGCGGLEVPLEGGDQGGQGGTRVGGHGSTVAARAQWGR